MREKTKWILIALIVVSLLIPITGIELTADHPSDHLPAKYPLYRKTLDSSETKVRVNSMDTIEILNSHGSEIPNDANIRLLRDFYWMKTYWEISWKEESIRVDGNNGEILKLFDGTKLKFGKEDRIGGNEKAIRLATNFVVKKLGLTAEELKNRFSSPRVVVDGLYAVLWQQEYNGIKVKNGYIMIYLNPETLEVVGFAKVIQDIKNQMANTFIKKEEASNLAENLLGDIEVISQNATMISIELAYGRGNNYWGNVATVKPGFLYGNPTAMWIVKFADSEDYFVAWIDAVTGKLIGGNASR